MVSHYQYFNEVEELSNKIHQTDHCLILCDKNTYEHCLLQLHLKKEIPLIIVSPGEINKTIETITLIWEKLVEAGTKRSSIIINIGGGVITDMGGMAASNFNRGIKFIHVPTTLMGMIDAAHGGKTGVNFKHLKNYIGTFSMPEEVWIWPGFLKTLDFREIKSGFAEMLKHGLIANKNYFNELHQIDLLELINNDILLESNIHKSIAIKNKLVELDFKDQHQRQLLNFGHTIGHGMESLFMDQNITHGECVAAGMICETYISYLKKRITEHDFRMIVSSIDRYFKRLIYDNHQIELLLKLIAKDKKNKQNSILCVLLKSIGDADFGQMVNEKEIKNSLQFYIGNIG